jgi:prepilin-type N-terminal cleavage/methylation domain-containing protein|tara:strand:+ start:26 stop:424 length:399 start_codon:yes stop_codon:yes gene_type:complete
MKNLTDKGFTLIEMLISVSLVLILSSIGIPIYNGYINDSKIDLAKSNLSSIYLAEINYFYENYQYYITGTTCGDHTELLINDLFMGEAVINKELFKYCVIKNNDGFLAKAIGNNKEIITIDHMNNLQIIRKG